MKKRGSQMDTWVKRTQRDYTLAFKQAVVEQVEKGELSYKQAQDRYGIQGRSTVLVWLRKYGRQNRGPMATYGRMTDPARSSSSQGLTPEQRIKNWKSSSRKRERNPNSSKRSLTPLAEVTQERGLPYQ